MILYSRWCSLPLPTRHKLAQIFGIIKKGSTEVSSNVIKFDGFMVEDIESAITVESMQKYLVSDEKDMVLLWEMVLAKANGNAIATEVEVVKEATSIGILPADEAKAFKKEYKARQKAERSNIKKVVNKKKNAKAKN